MRVSSVAVSLAVAVAVTAETAGTQKVVKESLDSGGHLRSYYLLVPENLTAPAPLLVLLHGSGRDGKSLVDPWSSLARKDVWAFLRDKKLDADPKYRQYAIGG